MTRSKPVPHLFGACAYGHHERCLGATSTGEMCTCEHHTETPPRCSQCRTDGEGLVDAGTRRCYDDDLCAKRTKVRAESNPMYQQLLDCRSRSTKMPKRVENPNPPKKRGAGACEHCGQLTRGGRFLPGHDAKLKRELAEIYNNGHSRAGAEALAEAGARGWVKLEQGSADGVTQAAFALIAEYGAEQVIQSGINTRLSRGIVAEQEG